MSMPKILANLWSIDLLGVIFCFFFLRKVFHTNELHNVFGKPKIVKYAEETLHPYLFSAMQVQ